MKFKFWNSFASGVGSVIAMSGGYFPLRRPDYDNGPQRDAANLAGDWQRVGGYIRRFIDENAQK